MRQNPESVRSIQQQKAQTDKIREAVVMTLQEPQGTWKHVAARHQELKKQQDLQGKKKLQHREALGYLELKPQKPGSCEAPKTSEGESGEKVVSSSRSINTARKKLNHHFGKH